MHKTNLKNKKNTFDHLFQLSHSCIVFGISKDCGFLPSDHQKYVLNFGKQNNKSDISQNIILNVFKETKMN